jgi:hypothetical protein
MDAKIPRLSRAAIDAQMQRSVRRVSRVVYEPGLDAAFTQKTKSAIRQAAGQKGLDLETERVSLWRESGGGNFEHLASSPTLLEALQSTDRYSDEVFLLDAIGGQTLILVIPPAEGGV